MLDPVTIGALSVNGLTSYRSAFGPLVPGARHAIMGPSKGAEVGGSEPAVAAAPAGGGGGSGT